eukprot:855314-Pelagomonas_calceolata.AAC.2
MDFAHMHADPRATHAEQLTRPANPCLAFRYCPNTAGTCQYNLVRTQSRSCEAFLPAYAHPTKIEIEVGKSACFLGTHLKDALEMTISVTLHCVWSQSWPDYRHLSA